MSIVLTLAVFIGQAVKFELVSQKSQKNNWLHLNSIDYKNHFG